MLEPSKAAFTEAQSRSAVAMLEEISGLGGTAPNLHTEFVDQVRAQLLSSHEKGDEWS